MRRPLNARKRFEILKRDGFKCQYCGKGSPDVELEVDHILPVKSGGTDDPDNLMTACTECNQGKGARQLPGIGADTTDHGDMVSIGLAIAIAGDIKTRAGGEGRHCRRGDVAYDCAVMLARRIIAETEPKSKDPTPPGGP
jgi:hypothetical protein